MKKFLVSVCVAFACVCLALFAGAGQLLPRVNAAGNVGYYVVNFDFDDTIFDIDLVTYTIDGVTITYNSAGEEVDGVKYFYKVEFSGETGALGLMEGEARTEYFVGQPFVDKFPSGYTVENAKLAVDPLSDVSIRLKFASDEMYKLYHLESIAYKVGESGSYYTIDSTELDKLGNASFKSDTDREDGFHYAIINTNYKFLYNIELNNFDMTIEDVYTSMDVRVSHLTKAMGVSFEGDGSDIGSSNRQYYSYADSAEINLTPDSANGEIIKSVEFLFGETSIFTLEGGMYSDGVYYFEDGETPSNVISYGNFALAFDSTYDYIQKDSDGNYAKLVVNNLVEVWPEIDPENPPTEPIEPEYEERELGEFERVEIRLDDNGQVTILSPVVPMWMTVRVTTQKYVQIDLMQVLDQESSKLTSEPFESVEVAGKVYPDGENPIPSRIFEIGFSDTIAIRIGLKEGYNFDETVNPLLIEGRFFVHGAYAGGHLVIGAVKENTFNINVYLYRDGVLFADSATKIYLSTNAEISSVEDFMRLELPKVGSSEGVASIRNVDMGASLKIYIQLSQYYLLVVDGESFAGQYLNLDYVVTENTNIIIDVGYFEAIRPVYSAGSEIGSIKIALYQLSSFVNQDGTTGIYATYEALFKSTESEFYEVIRKTNPSVYGYNLVNMSVAGIDFLKPYDDDSFGIDQQDVDIHKFLSEVLFGVPENGQQIVARFTEKKNEFSFDYNGMTYNGEAYYGKTQMYLEIPVEIVEPGMYFGGLYYFAGDAKIELLTIENQTPEFITEGEFAGMTKYELLTPWNLDHPGMLLNILTLPRTYLVSFVITTGPNSVDLIEQNFKYGDSFSVEELVLAENTPVLEAGYNLIGWNINPDQTVNYVIADESEYPFHCTFSYDWVNDVRFVPVFSASTTIISVHIEGMDTYSVSVRFDELVDFEKLFCLDGVWIEPQKFGYDFLGYFDQENGSGNHLIEYVGGETLYAGKFEDNPNYFGSVDGVPAWNLLENLDIYAVFREIEYNLTLNLINNYIQTTPITDLGTITALAVDKFYVSGFTILDTLTVARLGARANYFIKSIYITIVLDDGSMVELDASYLAECGRDGVVQTSVNDGRVDEERWALVLAISDFVNPETNGAELIVDVEYEAVTYIVSFSGTMMTDSGKTLYVDNSAPLQYRMEVQYANIEFVDHWERLTAEGIGLGRFGWVDLTVDAVDMTYSERTLFGISGLNYEADGINYSFKAWKDFGKNFKLSADTWIDSAYNFVCMYSDKFDVTVNYYIFNNSTNQFVKHGVDGYFWTYDTETREYFLDNPTLVNSYEIYLVNGGLYYINAWCDTQITEFGVIPADSTCYDLMSVIDVDYQVEALDLNFYAVYAEYEFSISDETDKFVVNASLPNDPNGNSYDDNNDVVWVKVDKARYDGFLDSKLSDADILSIIFPSAESIEISTIATGLELDKSLVPDDTYVFAVVERKLDGEKIGNVYVALKVN